MWQIESGVNERILQSPGVHRVPGCYCVGLSPVELCSPSDCTSVRTFCHWSSACTTLHTNKRLLGPIGPKLRDMETKPQLRSVWVQLLLVRWLLQISANCYRASACLCMQSAMLLWQICPSVRPSVTLWYCIETNAHIVKLFTPSGREVWLFLNATAVTKFQEELPQAQLEH